MGLLGNRGRSVVGLDIEPGFLAAAEFSNGGRPALQRAATGELRPGLFDEGEVADVDGLAEQLRSFFREHDLPKIVRLGVASQKIVVRVIELPDIEGKDELEAAVRFQAQEELPMPLEQAVLDHRVLDRYSDGESTRMRVLMVAARREPIDHLLAAARKAGLDPQLIDLSAFAIVRALYVPPDGSDAHMNGAGVAQAGEQPDGAEPAAQQPGPVSEQPADPAAGLQLQDVTEATPQSAQPAEPAVAAEPADVPAPDPSASLADLHGASEPAQPAPVTDVPADPAATQPQVPEQPVQHAESVAEPEAQAVIAATPVGADDAVLYCHVGGLTNLAIAIGTECVFNRVLQNGIEPMALALAERKGLTLEHARQWLKHVALERPIENIEGDQEIIAAAREVLDRGVSKIADEVRLSLEYYRGSVADAKHVNRVVLAGPAIALAGFPAQLERQVGLAVEPRSLGAVEVRPGALDNVDGAHVTVAAGLAIEETAP